MRREATREDFRRLVLRSKTKALALKPLALALALVLALAFAFALELLGPPLWGHNSGTGGITLVEWGHNFPHPITKIPNTPRSKSAIICTSGSPDFASRSRCVRRRGVAAKRPRSDRRQANARRNSQTKRERLRPCTPEGLHARFRRRSNSRRYRGHTPNDPHSARKRRPAVVAER